MWPWLCRESVVEVDCLFQVSWDWLIKCYHFISLSALAIYFVICYTEQSELLLVALDEKNQELCTLVEDPQKTVWFLCSFSFFADHIRASFQMCILNKEADYPNGNTVYMCPEEYVQEIVLKPVFLMTVLQHQFHYGLNK